jgi:hypothetical protein
MMRQGHGILLATILLTVALSGCFHSAASENLAEGFVSSERFKKLIVEVDYAEGYRPRDSAISLLQQRINERLDKPGGVTFEQRAFAATRSTYSNDDLRALEQETRDHTTGGDTIVLRVLYVNGGHASDTNQGRVLGVQFARTAVAIFKNTVDTSGGLLGVNFNAADVERAVLIHEFGHAIGLVNNGLPMIVNREDADHPKHSTNRDSVMFWAIENTSGLPLLDRIANNFDQHDIQDIRAAGGK